LRQHDDFLLLALRDGDQLGVVLEREDARDVLKDAAAREDERLRLVEFVADRGEVAAVDRRDAEVAMGSLRGA
jgi:hypothetical protein